MSSLEHFFELSDVWWLQELAAFASCTVIVAANTPMTIADTTNIIMMGILFVFSQSVLAVYEYI